MLSFTTQNGITGSFNSVSGALTLTGTATVANYQTALESVTYTDTNHDASTAARTISFIASDGVNSSNTATKTVSPLADVATQLVITTQPPSTVTAGSGFGLTITAEDAQGNVATSFTGSETVALASNPGSSTLGGTLTVTAANGVATYSGLTLNKVGSSYTLAVTSGTLTAATSSAISVAAGTATQLLITTQPPSTVTAGAGFGFTVTAEDAEGNVTSFASSVTVTLASNPGGSIFDGTTTVTATAGIAAFSGLTLGKAGSGYTLQVTSNGLLSATTGSFTVVASSEAIAQPNGPEFRVNTFTTGSQASPKVASDAAGDYVVVWQSNGQDGSGYGIYAQRFNAAGVAQGSEFRVNTYTTGDQSDPSVAMDSAGDFVIVWQSNLQDGSANGIYAQRYNASGAAVGSEFRVNTYTTNNQLLPSVAMDSAGDFVVVWQSYAEIGIGDSIFAQRYNASGMAVGSEFRVNTDTNYDASASVAMDSAGDFVVAWEDSNDGSGIGIDAQRFNAAGVAQGSQFLVNTYTTTSQRFPTAAMDSAGDFVIAWTSMSEDGSGYGIFAQRYNASGGTQGSEFRVNTYTTGNQGGYLAGPSAAMDSAGDFVVAWSSLGQDGSLDGVYAQRYNSVGVAQGNEIRVNTYTSGTQGGTYGTGAAMDSTGDFVAAWQSYGQDGSGYGVYAQRYTLTSETSVSSAGSEFRVNTYTTNNQQNPKVAIDAAGDYVVVWQSNGQDGSGYGVYAQRYNAAGVTQGSEFRVNTYTTGVQAAPTVAIDSAGDFIIAWYGAGPNGYGIYARQYNAAGVVQTTSEFLANTTTTGGHDEPAIAVDSAGDFVIAWRSQDGSFTGIYAQRYNAAGVNQGSEFLVNTYTTNAQFSPTVAMDSVGDFVVAWSSEYQDGSSFGIYAQRYNAAGALQGSEFRVNTYTTGGQSTESAAMDSAGDFVIAWESYEEDGSSYAIYAQRYNATGASQGSEFRVNTYTTDEQVLPTVAMDSAGNFVVAWTSDTEDGSRDGIFAQRYNAAGTPQGSEFRVNTYTTDEQSFPSVATDADGDFVVAWQSEGEDGNLYGIYAQRYSSLTTPVVTASNGSLTYTANSGRK